MHKNVKNYENLPNQVMGIHMKALIEYYQMSTHMPGFQSFSSFLTSFDIDQVSPQQDKGYNNASSALTGAAWSVVCGLCLLVVFWIVYIMFCVLAW